MAISGAPTRSRCVRTCVDIGRLGLLSARRAVQVRRTPSRWWSSVLNARSDIRLVPASLDATLDWQTLVNTEGARPERTGLTSSPLGSDGGPAEWIRRCARLRSAARRGLAYPYLVHIEGMLAGEALAFTVGRAPAAVPAAVGPIAQLLVWLAPSRFTVERYAATVEVLALHLFAGPEPPARVVVLVDVETATVGALESIGFVTEGVLRDPPLPNRAVLVARRDAGATGDRL